MLTAILHVEFPWDDKGRLIAEEETYGFAKEQADKWAGPGNMVRIWQGNELQAAAENGIWDEYCYEWVRETSSYGEKPKKERFKEE
jgi:hypothetical protein